MGQARNTFPDPTARTEGDAAALLGADDRIVLVQHIIEGTVQTPQVHQHQEGAALHAPDDLVQRPGQGPSWLRRPATNRVGDLVIGPMVSGARGLFL